MTTHHHLDLLIRGYVRLSIGFKTVSTIIYDTMKSYSERKHISIGLCGSFHSGKSTLGGRMLYEYNTSTPLTSSYKQLNENWLSYFDETEEEQIREMSIHGNMHELFTISYQISLIDTPGYIGYIKNYIRYISQSDVIILVFGANEIEIPKSSSKKQKKSIKNYHQLLDKLYCAKIFEIKQIIVVINKLDLYNYSQQKYLECRSEIIKLLKTLNYWKQNEIAIIPISGINGDNVKHSSSNIRWWNGYTLYEAIELISFHNISIYNNNIISLPFLMSICNIYDETVSGSILSGRISYGGISVGDSISCFPSGCCGEIKSIQIFNKNIHSAKYGDIIGIHLNSYLLHPFNGDIVVKRKSNINNDIKSFEAIIDVYKCDKNRNKKGLNIKYFAAKYSEKYSCFLKGFSPIIYVASIKQCQCQLIDIIWKTGNNLKKIKNPKYIEMGDTAKVLFEPKRQFAVTKLSKIIIFEHQSLIISGKVTKLNHADEVIEDLK